MKQKVTYILSNIDKALAFEWIVEALKSDFSFEFILIGLKKGHLYHWLEENQIPVYHVKYRNKKDLPIAWWQTYKILRKTKPNTIHTHLFEANIIGLTSGKILGIKKRIYTRHHSTFHHEFFPKAVKWDLRTNKWATDIVAISENVKKVLLEKENTPIDKVHLINHGFDLSQFQNVPPVAVDQLRKKYNIKSDNTPIIGCISRYIDWKGIQYVIDAFKKLTEKQPNAHLILANASGPDQQKIKDQLKDTLSASQYTEIVFENNLFALYHLFDIYVHAPINETIEAFGQTYVEALAAGVPSVFTLSGVANEFINHKENAWIVPYKDSKAIYEGIVSLLGDEKLAARIKQNGYSSIKPFSLNLFIEKLAQLYAR